MFKTHSRVAAIVLTLAMLYAMLPMNVFAETLSSASANSASQAVQVQNGTAETDTATDNWQLSGNNSFGNLLTSTVKSFNNGNTAQQATPGYSVTGIEMNGNAATVEYNAAENCVLVVGVYSEDGLQMLGSGNITAFPDTRSAQVTISIAEMPQYYLVKAFLVDSANHFPLSNVYTCELYTKSIQDVMKSTIEDYEGREILNLDDDTTTNFAVYNPDVAVIEQTGGNNVYMEGASDPDKGRYVFSHADSEFASLQEGDIFSHERGTDLFIGKIKSIEAVPNPDGSYTVTVTEDDDIDLGDVFDYVKIENNGKFDSYELDESFADEGLTDAEEKSPDSNGVVPSPTPGISSVEPSKKGLSFSDTKTIVDFDKKYNKKISADGESDHFSGHAEIEVTTNINIKVYLQFEVYVSRQKCYVDLALYNSIAFNGNVTGMIDTTITFPQISIKLAGGCVKIGLLPKIKFSASANMDIDASFTYKAGFHCSTDSGFVNTSDNRPDIQFHVKIEGEVYFGLEMTPSLTVMEANVGKTTHYLTKISIPVEVGLRTTGTLEMGTGTESDESDESGHSCKKCIDGDFYIKVAVTPSFKFLAKENMGKETAKIELSEPVLDKDIKIGDWYYSYDRDKLDMGTCPYKHTKEDTENGNLNDGGSDNGGSNDEGSDDGPAIGDFYTGRCGESVFFELVYDEDSLVLVLSGSGDMFDYGCNSPAPWDLLSYKITDIFISEGITSIGSYIFANCSNVTNVTIPDSVTFIKDSAFENCSSLKSITIPRSVTDIGEYAFLQCTSLENVTLPDSITQIDSYTFSMCKGLKSVTIPHSVETIRSHAFAGCTVLENVEIPDSVTTIEQKAFFQCSGLKSISLPNSVTSIEKEAFWQCKSLESITIPNSVKLIKESTFSECDSLESVIIPESVKSIQGQAFSFCSNLTSIELPDSIDFIGARAFFRCTSLEKIKMPAALKKITTETFLNCYRLTSVRIPSSVTSIETAAFKGCQCLKNITIPDSVTGINKYAFDECAGLTNVYYTGSKSDWQNLSIEEDGNRPLINAAKHYHSTEPENNGSTDDNSDDNDPEDDDSDKGNVLKTGQCGKKITFTLYESGLLEFSGSGNMDNYDNSSSTPDSIAPWYENREQIKKVRFIGKITSIGDMAFYNCINMEDFKMPNSINRIGRYAFWRCEKLKSVTLPHSLSTIDKCAFYNCTGLTSITIPDSVTSISDFAFISSSNLTSVTIPESVISIGTYAFFDCRIQDVYYAGSEKDWKKISLTENGNTSLSRATFHYGKTDPDDEEENGDEGDTDNEQPGRCGDNITYTISDDGVLEIKGYGDMYQYSSSNYNYAPWYNDRSKIKSIRFDGRITSIGDYAFLDCSYFSNITMPDSLVRIGSHAFEKCNMTKIVIPDSVTMVGEYAFSCCQSLRDITIPNSVTRIENYTFVSCGGLTDISIPGSVTSIGNYAFKYCMALKNIEMTNSIKSIGEYAFYGCRSLTSIELPDSVTHIESSSFGGCTSLESITVPESLTGIGSDAFRGCSSLKNITLPDTVSWIDFGAFSGCSSLKSFIIPHSVSKIFADTFGNCSELTYVVIPDSVTLIGIKAFSECTSLTDVYYAGTSDTWAEIDKNNGNEYLLNATRHYNATGPAPSPTPLLTTTTHNVLTASFDQLIPGQNYLFVVSKSAEADSLLDADHLLFIDEKTAGASGKLTFKYQPREHFEGAVVQIFGPLSAYDLSPNVNGGASKLFEPWGLKYFATFDGDDSAHISDRGIAILKDTYYSDDMTPGAFCSDKNANIFLSSKGELEFENPTEKYPNGRYAATLTKGIYSYDISAGYYVVPFAVMDNGQIIYGKIKSNSMERILNNNLSSTSVSDTEKAISRCILALKETVAKHYAAIGIPSVSEDMAVPRGHTQTAAPSVRTMTESGITPNVVAGAARLIEPWGMRYYVTYTASSNISDRGAIMLSQQSYDSVYSHSPDKMRLNKNAFIFRESDGTLVYDAASGRYAATVTEGISSKDIADLYYVVPFVVLNDGSYVYGNVKSHSMKNILTRNQDKDNVPDTEKAVSRDIIALYEAVKAYYDE